MDALAVAYLTTLWIALAVPASCQRPSPCTLRTYLDGQPTLSIFREVARRTTTPGDNKPSNYEGHLSNLKLANTFFLADNAAWRLYLEQAYGLDLAPCDTAFPSVNRTTARGYAACVLDIFFDYVTMGQINGKPDSQVFLAQTYRMNIIARQSPPGTPLVMRADQLFAAGAPRRCWKSYQAQAGKAWGAADTTFNVCADTLRRTLSGSDTSQPARIKARGADIRCGRSIIHLTDSVIDYSAQAAGAAGRRRLRAVL